MLTDYIDLVPRPSPSFLSLSVLHASDKMPLVAWEYGSILTRELLSLLHNELCYVLSTTG